jgi:hypothetical protein
MAISLDSYNFTWGEQPPGDVSLTSEYQLPSDWVEYPKTSPTARNIGSWSIIEGVLSNDECQQWRRAIEQLGGYDSYDTVTDIGQRVLEDSAKTGIPVIWSEPVSIRTNNRRIWQVPSSVTDELYQRIRPCLPPTVTCSADKIWELSGINRRFRFFETRDGKEFHRHIDAACARLNDGRYERSFYTLVIWLNGDYQGGELLLEGEPVAGTTGSGIVFPQDGCRNAVRHQGLPVKSGTKYILRTDVYYRERDPPSPMRDYTLTHTTPDKEHVP